MSPVILGGGGSLWHWPNPLLARMGILLKFGLVNIKMYRDFDKSIFIFTSLGHKASAQSHRLKGGGV